MNGQAKIDFLKQSKYIESIFNELPKIYQNALIIEFFDSVGIYINISTSTFKISQREFNFEIKDNDCKGYGYLKRQQATEKALEKAITLYNEKFKENE